MFEFDLGQLALDEGIRVANVGCVSGNKCGSLVCDVAEDHWDFDEMALVEETVGKIWDQVVVDSRSVHVKRSMLGVGERCIDILALEVCNVQVA